MNSIVYFNRWIDRYEKYIIYKVQLGSAARVKKRNCLTVDIPYCILAKKQGGRPMAGFKLIIYFSKSALAGAGFFRQWSIWVRDSAEVTRIFISMRIRSASWRVGLKAPKFRTSWKSVLWGKNLRIGPMHYDACNKNHESCVAHVYHWTCVVYMNQWFLADSLPAVCYPQIF